MKAFRFVAISIKNIMFVLSIGSIGVLVYAVLFQQVFSGNHIIIGLLILWALTSYLVLPRAHRLLTRLYLPDYFLGRVRTGDGFLGDPVNLGIIGDRQQIINAFQQSGWVQAEPITPKSAWRMFTSTVFKRSYPTAPVSDLFLFGHPQDLAFQQEVDNNPRARHHVRFWKTPDNWHLPGGIKVDYLGAGTYDKSVGFSLFTGQFTHKIESKIDEERDYIWQSLPHTQITTDSVSNLTNPYATRGGTGDYIETDGTLVIIKFN